VPPVEVSEKKIQRTTAPSRHKIKVLRAKKKVAVRPTAQTDILPDVAKKVVPVPGPKMPVPPVPPAVNERPEGKTAPPSVPEKRETVTEQTAEKKAPVDNTEQASPQNNTTEEVAPSKVPVSPLDNNGKQVQLEPEVIGNGDNGTASATGEKLSSDEAVAQPEAVTQPVTQSGEEKGSQPSLPPIPEEENDGEEILPEPAVTGNRDNVIPSESGEMSPTNNGVQPKMQSSDEKEAVPSLPPLFEAENDENDEQAVPSIPLAVEQGDVVPTPESEPESENKISANEMVQSEAQDDVVEKNNSSTPSSPERENNDLSLPPEDL
jgi:hypothetical protein